MTISYNWLSEYLPVSVDPEVLSGILTSIGLEVESMEKFEEIKGGMKGLFVGEVMGCEKHPDADKLKITTVNVGQPELLNIVCGASNVAAGQKVIVATIGCTLHPIGGEPFSIKKSKIRGVESQGMICAEDEIGLGNDHSGIIVLPENTIVGTPAAELYKPHSDIIYEIGLTPNRMDAMSHLGVARDVCAYLSYHRQDNFVVKHPYDFNWIEDTSNQPIAVAVENPEACSRYCGVSISNIAVTDSPEWLQQKLKSIGLRPINNIVDITNFILHETGQPLHAFDASKISGNKVIVKFAEEGKLFKTLDEKERKLHSGDLMICNEEEPMCIAGVYGGMNSGVSANTTSIFLESACFDKGFVRKTALRHELRTDAATRFEKGVDISNTLNVLKRAALLITEIAGGKITGAITDIFPNPQPNTTVEFSFNYLEKLSGKKYNKENVKSILKALGFDFSNETENSVTLSVPFSKSDISIQADIVEEIMRIDGLDNIEIPTSISIIPSVEKNAVKAALKEKLSNYLVGLGFNEIFTNSITNSAYYDEATLASSVKMMNSLSSELNILRPEMIQSGLEVISHNLNRKNNNLRMFEIGKTYAVSAEGKYFEKLHLCLYITGNLNEAGWKYPAAKSDFYYLKGVAENLCNITGLKKINFQPAENNSQISGAVLSSGRTSFARLGEVAPTLLKQFEINQPVFYADIDIDFVLSQKLKPVQYKELSKFPVVNRDLAVLVDKNVSYSQLEQIALSNKIEQLTSVQLFDIFESEKLGAGKKSMAVSFTFLDENKTLTDVEIDGFMQKIISGYEKSLSAEIRK